MQYQFNTTEHLHILDGRALTGTSSIGNVLAKPLTWWASGLAVEKFGWLNPKKYTPEVVKTALEEGFKKVTALSLSNYEKLLGEAYKAHSVKLKDSAVAGTDLHAEIEDYVKAMMKLKPIRKYDEKIQPFIDWADENIVEFKWSEAHCFDEEMFIGGISDIGAKLKDGKLAVIDIKSSKEAYPAQFLQCAGYAIQIEKNGLWDMGGTVNKMLEQKVEALIIVPFGADKIEPAIRYDVESYKQGFRSAVVLYRLLGLEK